MYTLIYAIWLLAAPPALAAEHDTAYGKSLGELVNQYRAQKGLKPLVADPKLSTLALEHSRDMAKDKRLHHDGFPARVKRSGSGMCLENVGWNYPTPQAQMDAWRASPGHDRNLLDRRVDRMAIAVASGYVTWMACGS